MRTRTKVLTWVGIGVPVLVGAAGAAYATYYHDRALPGSSVVGIDVAGLTRDEVANALRAKADGVVIDLTLPDGHKQASLADLGTAVDVDATLARVFSANEDWSSYAKALRESRPVAVVTTADRTKLSAFLTDLGESYARRPVDATVSLAKNKESFTVSPGVAGRSLEATGLADIAAQAAASLTSSAATTSLVDREPEVTTAEAKALADKANAVVQTAAEMTAGERTFAPSEAEKASWVTLPADVAAAPEVDAAKVTAWVAAHVKSIDTAPTSGMRYLTSTGTLLRVITPASDGIQVTNSADVATSLTAALDGGKDTTATVKTKVLPATWTERTLAAGAENLAYPAVAGEKWVDVNLSAHTMTPYVGGKAAASTVKMVNGAKDTPSDVGTFHIYMKNPLMTMTGQNADGTDYETPDVPWSSFYNGGEALHGAYWRKTWGYAASHGCINLPIPTAKWIYDWAPIGTPVVVHN